VLSFEWLGKRLRAPLAGETLAAGILNDWYVNYPGKYACKAKSPFQGSCGSVMNLAAERGMAMKPKGVTARLGC
jgi:hypothetical protein